MENRSDSQVVIQHELNGKKGAFFVEKEGNRLAEMTYSKINDQLIIIDHTEVSDALRGQGVGRAMVQQSVEMARDQNIKILPLCPFAKSVFQKVEEIRDVLK
ncbi:MAG: GNAT family N-acetyltransferase [Bacteroidota bacterium]